MSRTNINSHSNCNSEEQKENNNAVMCIKNIIATEWVVRWANHTISTLIHSTSLHLDFIEVNRSEDNRISFTKFITCKRGSAAVVRATCYSYGKGQILHHSRAEPIKTKFWKWDKENYQIWLRSVLWDRLPMWVKYTLFRCRLCFFLFLLFRWSGYRPQFATDFDVLY